MKAVRIAAPGQAELIEIPEPRITQPRQVKIRVRYISICADDTDNFLTARQRELSGHEFSGVLTKVGKEAEALGFEPGDEVTGYTWKFCGECPYCRRGMENLCVSMTAQRGLQEYLVLDIRQIVKVPDSVPLQLASLSELAASCIHGIDRAGINMGDSVLILGGGGGGLLLLQLAQMRGAANVVVSEPMASRRALCKKLGADAVIDPYMENFVARSMDLTDGMGFQRVLDASKNEEALPEAVSVLSRGGTLLLFSLHEMRDHISVNLPMLYSKEITLLTSYMAPYLLEQTMAMLPRLELEALRSAPFPLERVQEAYEAAHRGTYPRVFIEVTK